MKEEIVKSLSVVYEVDDLNLDESQGNDDLARVLVSDYPYWSKVLKVSLEVLSSEKLNKIFLYNLVILADTSLTTIDDINSAWESFSKLVHDSIEEFLNLNKVNYKKLS